MNHFTIPCAMRIDTKGVLDIPEAAEVVINDNGEYAGYMTAEGDIFAHRNHPADLEAYLNSAEAAPAAPTEARPEPAPVPEPVATGPTAEALTEAAPSGQPMQEAGHGEADSQQAG